ncbi:hypothetical protein DID77_03565, partial [Candidatus Marinamargulisbacteria bacterium SCGC AG-439-L15]
QKLAKISIEKNLNKRKIARSLSPLLDTLTTEKKNSSSITTLDPELLLLLFWNRDEDTKHPHLKGLVKKFLHTKKLNNGDNSNPLFFRALAFLSHELEKDPSYERQQQLYSQLTFLVELECKNYINADSPELFISFLESLKRFQKETLNNKRVILKPFLETCFRVYPQLCRLKSTREKAVELVPEIEPLVCEKLWTTINKSGNIEIFLGIILSLREYPNPGGLWLNKLEQLNLKLAFPQLSTTYKEINVYSIKDNTCEYLVSLKTDKVTQYYKLRIDYFQDR